MKMKARNIAFTALAACLAVQLTGCGGMLDPQGPRAREIYNLWWFLFALGTIVFVLTMATLVYALVRKRDPDEDERERSDPIVPVVIAGGVIPAVILAVLVVANLMVMASARATDELEPNLTIEIIGHMWWWEVRYPEQGFVTANEIHIPVGQVVRLEMTSADVIHSFWVPQLQGKMDLSPGLTNTLTIEATNPGEYQGWCAEFCGDQHTNMRMLVIAQSQSEFEAWAASQQRDAPDPVTQQQIRGQQLFLAAACMFCHAIRGTGASGQVGPDLTHVASRRTLGAATVENIRANLASWVLDPHSFKPGVFMPATRMSLEDIDALVAYLESLR